MNRSVTPELTLHIDGQAVRVPAGASVAAALCIANRAGLGVTRTSVSGQARAPFCGMGICHECRVAINGSRQLACQTRCTDGMRVKTSA